MGEYRKILIAIDGSGSSVHALKEAFKLARDEKSWVTVVSVVPPYEGDLGSVWVDNVKESMSRPCVLALSQAEEIAKEQKVLVRTVCEEGDIHERIVDLADAEDFDLIVMGRKGRSQIEKALIGSVTERVIGHTRKDVLVTPEDSTIGWKKILLATDGSKYSQPATARAVEFAKAYGSDLHIISVVEVTQEFFARAPQAVEDLISKARGMVDKIKESAVYEGIKAEGIVREGEEAYKVIVEAARDRKVDAIIMGSRGRTGLRRLLMGSVTEKVIGYAPCPVLVVQE
jgi:nucleotide-binding universal stress UspA family protein